MNFSYSLPFRTKKNVINFFEVQLDSLTDISNWDTKNLSNIQNMFYYCSSLKSLPDISKWNTNNITKWINIFFKC